MQKFIRTCQECGHQQTMKDPSAQKSDNWRDAKCRRCKSESLDFGAEKFFCDRDNTKPAIVDGCDCPTCTMIRERCNEDE